MGGRPIDSCVCVKNICRDIVPPPVVTTPVVPQPTVPAFTTDPKPDEALKKVESGSVPASADATPAAPVATPTYNPQHNYFTENYRVGLPPK